MALIIVKYPHTPWVNGLVESKNTLIGRFIRTRTQQNNIHMSGQAHIYTFAHNTQTRTRSQFSPNEMVCKEKPRIPIEIHLEITHDQKSICTISFFTYLPTHSDNATTDQNKRVQPPLSNQLLT